MDRFDKIIVTIDVVLTLVLCCMIVVVYLQDEKVSLLKSRLQNTIMRCQCDLTCADMPQPEKYCLGPSNATKVYEGLAFNDEYFCVWAKDRDISDTLNICAHEWAHTHEGLKDP